MTRCGLMPAETTAHWRELPATAMVPGVAAGVALVLDEPLSLWGGLDAETGRITDVHHPQHGQSVTGRVLVMPTGRGSSSASSVLAEAVRVGTAPVAIVLSEPDEIVALGSLVAEEIYGTVTPVVVLAPQLAAKHGLATGHAIEIDLVGVRVANVEA